MLNRTNNREGELLFYNSPQRRPSHTPFTYHGARPFDWGMPNEPRFRQQPPFYQHNPYQYQPHSYYNQPSPNFLEQLRKSNGDWDYEKIINHGGQIVSI